MTHGSRDDARSRLAIGPAELAALHPPPVRPGGRGLLEGFTLGPYRLGALLGAGGMAEVYRATPTGGGPDVAVKVLRGAGLLDEEARRRFRREARVVATVSDPHVVPVLDAGERDGTCWLAMPLVDGESLHRWVAANGPLPWRLALRVIGQAARGLAAVHQSCIVHRDVKPANLLLSREGRVRLADFGVASDGGGTGPLTCTGQALGTPSFMSPEQCTGGAADARSDLYSLGATLFFCLTGRPPFGPAPGEDSHGHGGPLGLLERHVRAPAPAVDAVNRAVPHALARAVAKCLEKRPGARYQTAAAFLDDCVAVLEGRTPSLASGDDTSVVLTRALGSADVPDDVVDTCLGEQAAARARGELPPPLGALLARRGVLPLSRRPARGAPSVPLHCAGCGPGEVPLALGHPVPRCPGCGGPVAARPGVTVAAAGPWLLLAPPDGGDDVGATVVALVADAVATGFLGAAVDLSAIERLSAEQTTWLTDACEVLLAGGGDLALLVPRPRDRDFLAAVGVDQYAWVVPDRDALLRLRPAPDLPAPMPRVAREEPTPVA